MDKSHPRTVAHDDGFTVAEMTIVVGLLPIILGIAFMLFNSTTGMSDQISARSVVTEQTRSAVDVMTRELRQSGEISDGDGAFATAAARQCVFYVDLYHDGVPERVTYAMSGVALVRTQASSTTSFPPFAYGADGAPTTLVATISPSFTGPIFTYIDPNGTILTPSQSDQCSAVGVHVVGAAPVPGTNQTVTADLSTLVKIRSLFNNIK